MLAWLPGVVGGGQRFVTLPDRWSVGGEVMVARQIVPLSGTQARIDYVLRPEEVEGGVRRKAIDVTLDDSISQVAVRRSEFYGLLRDGGVAKLIATPRRSTPRRSAARRRTARRRTARRRTARRRTACRRTGDLSGGALSRPAGNAASGTLG
jgi:hypothetical protein